MFFHMQHNHNKEIDTTAPDGSWRKKENVSEIFKNRYQAERIIKVYGGCVLMDAEDYSIWKIQK